MMEKRTFFAILLISLLLFSCKKVEIPEDTGGKKVLDDLVSKIEKKEYGGEVHSLLIMKDDSIQFEKYFNGYSREKKHHIYSVTKSFTSSLIGICIQKGYIESVNERALDFFPYLREDIVNDDPQKAEITIADLLTMRAGLSWDEWTIPYSSSENLIFRMTSSKDWVKFVFDQPMANAPGTQFAYNSGASNVLSAIITATTGKSAKDFAAENLFNPMGITDFTWENSGSNISVGGWGLWLRPIDMIKFGQLFLHKGKWNNVQLITENWVEESTRAYCKANQWCDYGYQWWRYGEKMDLPASDIFFAAGRGEQYIWVLPSFNAVVVCTAWNDGGHQLEYVLWDYVLDVLK